MMESFSERNDYRAPDAEITIREDAPQALREALVMLAYQHEMTYTQIRAVICEILLVAPDRYNWTEVPHVRDEVFDLISGCPWFKVYNIAERLWHKLLQRSELAANGFAGKLNQFLAENGIGWEIQEGQIVFRGESFTPSTKEAVIALEESARPSAANELREAIRDISRRPDPDVTGAIQHSMAALEASARDLTGKPNQNLGQLIGQLDLPAPLDGAIDKLWGYTSQYGRHVSEVKVPDVHEAELVVSIAAALCTFLVHRE